MKRVFILGSGFSAYAGAPISRTVLSAVFSPERMNTEVNQLKSFLSKFLFREENNWIHSSGLEEVLSRLDLIRHYKPYPDIDYNQVSFFEELLLREFIKLLTPENTDGTKSIYLDFGRLICSGDTIISFNYDLVVEQLLKSCGKSFRYCVLPEIEMSSSIELLKLHGSINLYYCPSCGKVYRFPEQGTEHRVPDTGTGKISSKTTCDKCVDEGIPVGLRHFIIAPTLFKSYTLPALRNLWFRALEVLKDASELYFIGYSMPEADILSYQLFDFAKRSASKQQSVFLICGPRIDDTRFRQIYQKEFKNTRSCFEEWIRTKETCGINC